MLKNLKTGVSIAEVPEFVLSAPPNSKVIAVGSQARQVAASERLEIINPFAHPRSLISDFNRAEQLLKHQVRRIFENSSWFFSPYIVLHPLGSPLGGLTKVEIRAFRELAISVRATEVFVWTGRPLTDQEILSRKPPPDGVWE